MSRVPLTPAATPVPAATAAAIPKIKGKGIILIV
jgi:hypothetical protein